MQRRRPRGAARPPNAHQAGGGVRPRREAATGNAGDVGILRFVLPGGLPATQLGLTNDGWGMGGGKESGVLSRRCPSDRRQPPRKGAAHTIPPPPIGQVGHAPFPTVRGWPTAAAAAPIPPIVTANDAASVACTQRGSRRGACPCSCQPPWRQWPQRAAPSSGQQPAAGAAARSRRVATSLRYRAMGTASERHERLAATSVATGGTSDWRARQ